MIDVDDRTLIIDKMNLTKTHFYLDELIYYGISAISLLITGSERREGIRACTSLIQHDQFVDLEARLYRFHKDHPI